MWIPGANKWNPTKIPIILFLVYVQDLPAWINEGPIQGYADDTLHFLSVNTPEEVIEKLETGSKEILLGPQELHGRRGEDKVV